MLVERSMSSTTSNPGAADAAPLTKINSATMLVVHLPLYIGDLRRDLTRRGFRFLYLRAIRGERSLGRRDLFLQFANMRVGLIELVGDVRNLLRELRVEKADAAECRADSRRRRHLMRERVVLAPCASRRANAFGSHTVRGDE